MDVAGRVEGLGAQVNVQIIVVMFIGNKMVPKVSCIRGSRLSQFRLIHEVSSDFSTLELAIKFNIANFTTFRTIYNHLSMNLNMPSEFVFDFVEFQNDSCSLEPSNPLPLH